MKQRQAARLGRPLPAKLAFELAGRMKAMSADQSGVAAIEFGIFALLLFVALANVVDVTMSLYQRMQAENATQVAAQAAWKACDLPKLPATVNCPGLTTAISKRAGKHLAWYESFPGVRLTGRGILLRQFIKRTAICQRCFIQTSRLHGCGYAEPAAG